MSSTTSQQSDTGPRRSGRSPRPPTLLELQLNYAGAKDEMNADVKDSVPATGTEISKRGKVDPEASGRRAAIVDVVPEAEKVQEKDPSVAAGEKHDSEGSSVLKISRFPKKKATHVPAIDTAPAPRATRSRALPPLPLSVSASLPPKSKVKPPSSAQVELNGVDVSKRRGKQKSTPSDVESATTRRKTLAKETPVLVSSRLSRKRPSPNSHLDVPPRKRRKRGEELDGDSSRQAGSSPLKIQQTSESISAPPGRMLPHRAAAYRPETKASSKLIAPARVKRVRLIVRRPPLEYITNPRQRPPAPRFEWSVTKFLSSYMTVNDKTFSLLDPEILRLIHEEAVLRERMAAIKRAGAWLGTDLFDAMQALGQDGLEQEAKEGQNESPPVDAWDAVVRDVQARDLPEKSAGEIVGGLIASKIKSYWEVRASKLEKGRAMEERRMKGVARAVMKLVIAEWKKAVYHVREQERIELEAEELRRGQDHLDAILDQSGQILETQQGAFARGTGDAWNSRSRSVSLSAWDEEDSDESEDEDQEQIADVEDEEPRRQEEEEEEDIGKPNELQSLEPTSSEHVAVPDDDMLQSDVALPGSDTRANIDESMSSHGKTPPAESLPSAAPYLQPYAVAPVHWDPAQHVTPPSLLRGLLRPYQQSGLEWLASLHTNNLNGILADEMGLGKTIQTISLLAHLACDRGIWGPHLIIVPTSVLLNWEMEFKKFLPGFRIVSYHGPPKRRKELRQGWNDKHRFNVCITSYTLASRDAAILKRKNWYYLILDEAHMIKNFKSQRWTTLLMFRSFRRLLLTGTPLQNNLTELWSLLQFLMSGSDFVNLKEFGDIFSNPLERAIEAGNILDEETLQRVSKLHTVLRPYLLRRLKRDVEKELPSKYEHLVLCPLSKRQRFLYDEFMSKAQTRDALESGVYQKIANILMQLRKVCNHPDLFEVRPIVTSFAIERSVVSDFEIKELLLRRKLLTTTEEPNLDALGFHFVGRQGTSQIAAEEIRMLDGTARLGCAGVDERPPAKDLRTIAGYRAYHIYQRRAAELARSSRLASLNSVRCNRPNPIYSSETLAIISTMTRPLVPLSALDHRAEYMDICHAAYAAVRSYAERAEEMATVIDRFAIITPAAVARDLPRFALAGQPISDDVDIDLLHRASVKLQIAFPDPLLLQYDCGKLQKLAQLLREKKAGGHRVLVFTQMTKILDILEMFLSFHGYLYLRLDGSTRIEDRQYITELFNKDPRIFCFIASSRSGGVGIKSVVSIVRSTPLLMPIVASLERTLWCSMTATSILRWTDSAKTGPTASARSGMSIFTVLCRSTQSKKPCCEKPTRNGPLTIW
ncbi:unnamed protein product [Mycena citricolor]|uniref:DNA helicase n=1 Tax=Mycena citricolor TaxID=2018698 RepID=A0AAD2K8J2_9AGAR|nr:unnamed protein product [Mycena citricolor]